MRKKVDVMKILVMFLFVVILSLIGYIVFTGNNGKKVEVLEVEDIDEFKNYDGTYASLKNVYYEDNEGRVYTLSLGLDGRVYNNYNGEIKSIENVMDAVDIVSFTYGTGELEDSFCYILTSNGRVYEYVIDNILSNDYKAKLITNVSEVERIYEYYYVPSEGDSGTFGVIAILEDGSSVTLNIN